MVLHFIHHPNDHDQWEALDAIEAPTPCLRGETLDLPL
jgi:hypothetical protein